MTYVTVQEWHDLCKHGMAGLTQECEGGMAYVRMWE